MGPAFSFDADPSPLVAVAVHSGHELRPEVADLIVLDDATRRREEDPGTDRLTSIASTRVTVDRSRFEVDLNRPRDRAVYARPEDAWGLQVWRGSLPADLVAASLEIYDAFYAALAAHLDVVAAGGRFVVLDLHSYNHRRGGHRRRARTGGRQPRGERRYRLGRSSSVGGAHRSLHHATSRSKRSTGTDSMSVRTSGSVAATSRRGSTSRYPDRGCALAIELKKTFMDEWTGEIDDAHLEALRCALAATTPGLLDVLGPVRR